METTAAWAAGLFEARGTVTTCNGRPRLSVRGANEQAVRRFAETIGEGRVYGPYGHASATERDGFERRPTFVWIAETDAARRVARALLPWLGDDRRAQIAAVLGIE